MIRHAPLSCVEFLDLLSKRKALWLLTLLQREMKKLQRRRQYATTNEGGI
jgi:hypothetical protein